jgi:hypothetical protein
MVWGFAREKASQIGLDFKVLKHRHAWWNSTYLLVFEVSGPQDKIDTWFGGPGFEIFDLYQGHKISVRVEHLGTPRYMKVSTLDL